MGGFSFLNFVVDFFNKIRNMVRFRSFGLLFSDIRASLPSSTVFSHGGLGVVIGHNVTVGKNVRFYQGVTVGSRKSTESRSAVYPVIGDNCVLYAGCAVLGNIRLGRGVVVGANSVVLEDVPDGCTVVGNPARIVDCRSSQM